MRKKINWFLGGCFAILVAAICVMLTSCDYIREWPSVPDNRPDSVYVTKQMHAVTNPSFASLPEVMTCRAQLVENYSTDEVFRSLPEAVLINVATVCLSTHKTVTKKDIVSEYSSNKAVYDNLPDEKSIKQTNKQLEVEKTPSAEKPIPIVSYRYQVDTIDGKPKRAFIKEEKTYEE